MRTYHIVPPVNDAVLEATTVVNVMVQLVVEVDPPAGHDACLRVGVCCVLMVTRWFVEGFCCGLKGLNAVSVRMGFGDNF